MGLNDFTDLTPEEFQNRFANLLPEKAIYEPLHTRKLQGILPTITLPLQIELPLPLPHN